MKLIILISLVIIHSGFTKSVGDKDKHFENNAFIKNINNDSLFEGIAALYGCSGSLVKFDSQGLESKAIIMTNDHCIYDQKPKKYIFNQDYKRTIYIYNKQREKIAFKTEKILYAEQTDTDVALLELGITFQDLIDKHDIYPFNLTRESASVDDKIDIVSGYWNKIYSCKIEANNIYKLKESEWIWSESYRYDCNTIGGTSGSPIILKDSREVIGINNTSNEKGQKCTLNNPCEIDQSGKITVRKGKGYGQQTKYMYTCLDQDANFSIKVQGCQMYGGDNWREK